MKSILPFFLAIIAVYGSPQQNIVLNVKQVVSGCGNSCESASKIDGGASQEIAQENTNACSIGNRTYPNGTDLINAVCSSGNWSLVYTAEIIPCSMIVGSSGLITFDLNLVPISNCSYDIVNVEGETTVSVFFTFVSFKYLKISNKGSDPFVCHYSNITTLWDCGLTSSTPLRSVPGQDILYTMAAGSTGVLSLMNYNGIWVFLAPGQLIVFIPRELKPPNLNGLCGNFNGNSTDDSITRNGKFTTDLKEVATSWQSPGVNCL